MADERRVDHDRQVAGHLKLVPAADRYPVDPRDGRLADLADAVVSVLERSEPLPVLVRPAEVVLVPGAKIRADAERAPGPRHDHDPDLVVPGRVLAGTRELPQHPEVEGVQDLRPVEPDRGAWRRLLVDDRLEAELRRIDRTRVGRLRHSTETKLTVKGMPIAIASFPAAAKASELTAVLNESMSSHSNSA